MTDYSIWNKQELVLGVELTRVLFLLGTSRESPHL